MSTGSSEIERLQRAFASLADGAPMGTCPDPETLWAAARGELPVAEVPRLIEHTIACGSCAEAWRLGRELSPTAVPRTRRLGWSGWGALVAAAALVALALLARGPTEKAAPEYREGMAWTIRAMTPETRPLPRDAAVLRWSPGPPGTRYDIRVGDQALKPIHEARGLTVAEHRVPPGALAGLPSGARLYWQVEALTPDGQRVVSPTFVARLE